MDNRNTTGTAQNDTEHIALLRVNEYEALLNSQLAYTFNCLVTVIQTFV